MSISYTTEKRFESDITDRYNLKDKEEKYQFRRQSRRLLRVQLS